MLPTAGAVALGGAARQPAAVQRRDPHPVESVAGAEPVDENFGLIIGQEPPGGSFGPQPGKAAIWQLPTGTNLGQ